MEKGARRLGVATETTGVVRGCATWEPPSRWAFWENRRETEEGQHGDSEGGRGAELQPLVASWTNKMLIIYFNKWFVLRWHDMVSNMQDTGSTTHMHELLLMAASFSCTIWCLLHETKPFEAVLIIQPCMQLHLFWLFFSEWLHELTSRVQE